MKHGGSSRKSLFVEINITPLTDIFLVLLVIILIVSPVLSSNRNDIKPPTIASGESVEPRSLTIEVAPDGSYFMDGQPLAETLLAQTLGQRVQAEGAKQLLIRGDKQTKSHAILAILEAAKDIGLEKAIIVGESAAVSPAAAAARPEGAPAP